MRTTHTLHALGTNAIVLTKHNDGWLEGVRTVACCEDGLCMLEGKGTRAPLHSTAGQQGSIGDVLWLV